MDRDGLVAQHEFLLPAPDDEVVPHLDRPVDVRVVWAGLSCRRAPEVEVTGDQDCVVVAIDRGPRVVGCDA
ncbi:MAG: hypothetical protein EA387_09655 [Nitriliruptor sp.]|nr:MAG: hypothetical protein EA387_09655 [Nitriliruptor sp.]